MGLGALWLGTNLRVVKEFECGVTFRFDRVHTRLRGLGLTLLIPIADRLDAVNMQIILLRSPGGTSNAPNQRYVAQRPTSTTWKSH